jgi:hypothetical protein
MALTKAHNRMIDGASVNVVDFGADPTGVADSTAAIQAAIDADLSNVYFPTGTYRTTSTINITGPSPSIYGVGKRYNVGLHSTILLDHAGDGIKIFDTSHIATSIENLEIKRSTTYAGQGNNLVFDNLPVGGNSVVSHTNVRRVQVSDGNVGILIRGLIFGTFESMTIQGNTTGIYFPGDIDPFPASNGTNFNNINIYNTPSGGYGMRFAGNAGRNMFFNNMSIETSSSATSIYTESGVEAYNIVFDGLWLEDIGPMRLEGGNWIYFNNCRFATSIDPIDGSAFGAENVYINGMYGGSANNLITSALVSQTNYDANKRAGLGVGQFVKSEYRGNLYTPAVSSQQISGTSSVSPVDQSGRLLKNYLFNWNISGSSSWDKTGATGLTTETDPLGGSTAYSWNGVVTGGISGGGTAMGTGDLHYSFWVNGAGYVRFTNRQDGLENAGMGIRIDSDDWVRIVSRFNNASNANSLFALTLTPDTTNGIKIWRPGAYSGVSSIDTRPFQQQSIYEGGDIDFTTYPYGSRQGANIIVYGTAAPSAGTWMVGDKVINKSPTAGGNIGWVCTTGGTSGTWKTFGTITA